MRKIIQFSFLFMVLGLSANAQLPKLPKALVFANFTYANPGSSMSNYNNGTGFEIGGGIGFGKTILYASTGYVKFSANSSNTNPGSLKVVPIKVGLRRYLIAGLFANVAAGIATQSYDANSATGSSFLYEAGVGIKILGIIELGAAYTGWKQPSPYSVSSNALLLKAGLALKL